MRFNGADGSRHRGFERLGKAARRSGSSPTALASSRSPTGADELEAAVAGAAPLGPITGECVRRLGRERP